MIIIDGPDKVGKTTLCRELAGRIPNARAHKLVQHPPDWDYFWDYVDMAAPLAIWDRGWLSEVAYQVATGRDQRLFPRQIVMLKFALALHGCLTVMVTCDERVLSARLDASPDDKYDKGTVLEVNKWFRTWAEMHTRTPSTMWLHCTDEQPFPEADAVYDILEAHDSLLRDVHEVLGEGARISRRAEVLAL